MNFAQYAFHSAVLTGLLLTTTTTPSAEANVLLNKYGKVLGVIGDSTGQGANVVQWEFDGKANQFWDIIDHRDGSVSLKNRRSDKVLGVVGDSPHRGANVVQWSYDGKLNQRWKMVYVDQVWFKLVNRRSGLVLDIAGDSRGNGGNVIQWDCDGGQDQLWRIAHPVELRQAIVPPGPYINIPPLHPGLKQQGGIYRGKHEHKREAWAREGRERLSPLPYDNWRFEDQRRYADLPQSIEPGYDTRAKRRNHLNRFTRRPWLGW